MPKFDPNGDLFPEGWHFFEVTSVLDKRTQKGVLRWQVTLKDLDTGRVHVERWWVESDLAARMTSPKLRALGLDLNQNVEAIDLIGRRMYGKIKHKDGKDGYGPEAAITSQSPEDKPPKDYNPAPVRPFSGNPLDKDDGPF